jgi:hypothetical protein
MAVVTGPLHSSEARGKIGGPTGLVYNTYRGRAYVKANATPINQDSIPRVAARLLNVTIHDAWAALSSQQRADWDHFADEHTIGSWTGTDKRLSGWNWFVKANTPLLQSSDALLTNPPNPITGIIIPELTYSYIDAEHYIFWIPATPAPTPAWRLVFWRTANHAITVHPSIKKAKRESFELEGQGNYIFAATPGDSFTYYVIPHSTQGISMPPIRFLVET